MDFIKRLIEARKAAIAELEVRNKNAQTVDELRSINAEIEKATSELRSAEAELARLQASDASNRNPFAGVQSRGEERDLNLEYRKAFMQFCINGTAIPAELRSINPIPAEFRAAGPTTTDDITAMVPREVLAEVIRGGELTGAYGQLYNRVRKFNIAPGFDVPVTAFAPTFNWVAQGECSAPEKVSAKETVSFKAYLGSAMVSVSFVAATTSLEAFEKELVLALREAFYKGMDTAIVAGTGVGQPTGIGVDTRVKAETSVKAADLVDWEFWNKNVWGKLPVDKQNASLIVSRSTAYNYLYNMKDGNGNPIKLQLDTKEAAGVVGVFMGRELILVEDTVMKGFDAASNKDVFGIVAPLRDYGINLNSDLGLKTFEDPKCHQIVHEALVIADGRPLDVRGMIKLKADKA